MNVLKTLSTCKINKKIALNRPCFFVFCSFDEFLNFFLKFRPSNHRSCSVCNDTIAYQFSYQYTDRGDSRIGTHQAKCDADSGANNRKKGKHPHPSTAFTHKLLCLSENPIFLHHNNLRNEPDPYLPASLRPQEYLRTPYTVPS